VGTKNQPGKFDCYSKLEPDEPHFVLMGRDSVGWITVLFWCLMRKAADFETSTIRDAEKLGEAQQCALAMRRWAIEHGKRDEIDRALKRLPPSIQMIFAELMED
jgi:hypothetical protein